MINTKYNPSVRSFLGGFFGALMALIPASIYNHFGLCLVGAVVGWAVAYHGDRIFYGLKHGWHESGQRMRSMKNKLMAVLAVIMGKAPKLDTSTGKISVFFRGIKSGFQACFRFIGSVKNAFVRLFCFLFVNWLKRCLETYRKDEIHKINLLRYAVSAVCALMVIGVTYTIGDSTLPVMKERGFLIIVSSSFLGLMPLLICFVESTERDHQYELCFWDSYHQSLGHFISKAVFFYLYATLWLAVATVFVFAALLVGTFGFVLIGVCGMMITLAGIRFSWHLVRINMDYGLISLVVALIVGATTFLVYREQLISNMGFLLTASITAAFISGLTSFGLTYLGDLLFERVNWLKKLMEPKKDDYSTWAIDKSIDLVLGKLGKYCFKRTELILDNLIPCLVSV